MTLILVEKFTRMFKTLVTEILVKFISKTLDEVLKILQMSVKCLMPLHQDTKKMSTTDQRHNGQASEEVRSTNSLMSQRVSVVNQLMYHKVTT